MLKTLEEMKMFDVNARGVRGMRTEWGCFFATSAVILFNMENVTTAEVMDIVPRNHPELFEGHDCETCGYDFPGFSENYSTDEHVEHSMDVCGYPAEHRRSEAIAEALAFEVEYGLAPYMDDPDPLKSYCEANAVSGDSFAERDPVGWSLAHFGYCERFCDFVYLYDVSTLLKSEVGNTLIVVERGEDGVVQTTSSLVTE